MKGVQCYELFGGIALKNHTFSFHFSSVLAAICCDATPIVCSSCQCYFHRTCSRLTRSQNGIQGFVCFLCSGGAATYDDHHQCQCIASQCLLCHTKIRLDIRPIMCQHNHNLAHGYCSGIFRYVAILSGLRLAWPLPTTSIPTPTKPTIAMTNNTHVQTVSPPATNTNSLFPLLHPHLPLPAP